MRHWERFRRALVAILAVVVAAVASAQTTVVWKSWTGLGSNGNWTNGSNWDGGTTPANNGTANLAFGSVAHTYVNVDAAQSVNALKFDFSTASGSFPGYFFNAENGSSLTIGSGGLTIVPPSQSAEISTGITFGSSLGIVLGADQTWALGNAYSSFLGVAGTISGSGKLTLNNGVTLLSGNNTYSGGTTLNNATVLLGSDTALGTGPLTISGSSYLEVGDYLTRATRVLNNALNLAGNLTTYNYGKLTLSGAVTMSADATLSNYGGNALYLEGNIGESGGARKLTVSSDSVVILSGNNTYSGGTAVQSGALIFRNESSVPPSNALTSFSSGYIGAGFNTNVQSGFIDRFDKATMTGTIGFDTDPSATAATTFSSAINLSGFSANVRLGSLTRAILSGAITPQSTTYRFGGGQGTLTIQSQLTGASDVLVTSDPSRELTLQLTNATNNYTGRTTAQYSAVVFSPGAMGAGLFKTNDGGYIGTNDATVSPASLIAKFDATTTTGVVGFDSASLTSPRTITDAIDLSPFTGATTSIALGTTSAVTLSGAFTLPAGQGSTYYFTGYKGGQLVVNTALTGTRSVQVGGISDSFGYASVAYPVRDPNDSSRVSAVFLNGANTYGGGTLLVSGRLVLGNTSALGTGPLQVAMNYFSDSFARLETSLTSAPTFANPIVVGHSFEIAGVNAFTLSGSLTDNSVGYSGTLVKLGNFNLTVSGANSGFSGGFEIDEGTITFATNSAAGTGRLWFGHYGDVSSSATPTAAFTSPAPTIGGLLSYTPNARVNLASGTTLTINENSESSFSGQFQGAGGIEKTGTGTLHLDGASASYTGPTKISSGTLEIGASGALGNNTVTLNGPAKLVVEHGVTLANPIAFGASGGTLAGYGTFGSAVTLTANSSVSPGSSLGLLTFSAGLTFGPGSSYDVQVQDATGTPGAGWDAITVNGTLAFTATLGSPLTVSLSSLASTGAAGDAANFVSTNPYSWQIATATGGITGFNPSAVLINSSGFTNSLGVGSFNVTTSGNSLFLNFTPVPEPSTWALLATGVGAIAFCALRRKRRP